MIQARSSGSRPAATRVFRSSSFWRMVRLFGRFSTVRSSGRATAPATRDLSPPVPRKAEPSPVSAFTTAGTPASPAASPPSSTGFMAT